MDPENSGVNENQSTAQIVKEAAIRGAVTAIAGYAAHVLVEKAAKMFVEKFKKTEAIETTATEV